VFKFKSWRRKVEPGKFVANPKVLEEYQSVGAELNIMPYCSQFIPMEVRGGAGKRIYHRLEKGRALTRARRDPGSRPAGSQIPAGTGILS
jgi:hypothetical protein